MLKNGSSSKLHSSARCLSWSERNVCIVSMGRLVGELGERLSWPQWQQVRHGNPSPETFPRDLWPQSCVAAEPPGREPGGQSPLKLKAFLTFGRPKSKRKRQICIHDVQWWSTIHKTVLGDKLGDMPVLWEVSDCRYWVLDSTGTL